MRGARTRDGRREPMSGFFFGKDRGRLVKAAVRILMVNFSWDVRRLTTFRVEFVIYLFTNEFYKILSVR